MISRNFCGNWIGFVIAAVIMCAAAAGLGLAPGTCGTSLVVTAAGGVVALNGIDNVQAGLRQVWTGKPTQTLTSSSVEYATGSHLAGELVDAGIGLVSPGGVRKFADIFKKTCFTAGTQIVVGEIYDEELCSTSYVTSNIEDIKVGDYVLAQDIETGEVSLKEVTDIFVRTSNHIRYLTTVDEEGDVQTIETTDSHPFWVVTDNPDLSRAASEVVDENGTILYHENIAVTEHGYYVEAKDLRVGDVFIGANGELTTLTETYREDFPNGITVYNFTVADNHNYFVIANLEAYENGASIVFVHNSLYKNPKINVKKQDGHVLDTPQYKNRIKQGDATSAFPDRATAEMAVTKTLELGTPVPKRPGVFEYDLKIVIGTNLKGQPTTVVRIHIDARGNFHGYPH
jgi:hypothetical protein